MFSASSLMMVEDRNV